MFEQPLQAAIASLRPPPMSRTWVGVLVAAAVLVDLPPLAQGVRRAADEVGLLFYLSDGWPLVGEVARSLAVHQGRIGSFFYAYLNAFGASVADSDSWRLAFAALHLATYAAFAGYTACILGIALGPLLLIIALALHPVSLGLMPPAVYPLQNDLAFLLLLLARWALLGDGAARHRSFAIALHAVLLIAMVISEYAFLLGSAVAAGEWAARWSAERRERRSSIQGALAICRISRFRVDVGLVLLVAAAYGMFRLSYPSQYEGNTLGGIANAGATLVTALRHILEGTSLPALSPRLLEAPPDILITASAAGVATACVTWRCLPLASKIQAPCWVFFLSIGLMLYVSLPIAASAKYQDWCLRQGTCAYLDSRLSYFGVPVLLVAAAAVTFRLDRGRFTRPAWAALLGALAALTYCSNWRHGQQIEASAMPWQRANALACAPSMPAGDLVAWIDPQGQVSFHADLDPAVFWPRYIAWKRQHTSCGLQR